MGIAKIRGEKEKKNWRRGRGRDHLGQTNYAEIYILVTKYFSKLKKYKIQITCHVFNYVFQVLVFQLVDNSANKHAEQPTFSHALPAAHPL